MAAHRLASATFAAFVLVPLAMPACARAESVDLNTLQREIESLRRDYDSKINRLRHDYEKQIKQLQAELKDRNQRKSHGATAHTKSWQEAPDTASAVELPEQPRPAAPAPPRPAPAPAAASQVRANAFNPQIGVILLGTVAGESFDPDNYRIPGFALGNEAKPPPHGLALGESEINLQANIDPSLFGSLTVAFDREDQVSVEEAYLQTTGLPSGFTVKGGRFYSAIGYLNSQHTHTWDFVDAPLPYRAFLDNQYNDDGVQVRWLAPTDMFLELGSEVFRGDHFPAGNAANDGFGTWTAFVHAGDDIDAASSWSAGLSYLNASARNRVSDAGDLFTGHQQLAILDFVYKWAPNGNPLERNLKIQAEGMLGHLNGIFDGLAVNQQQYGYYAQAVYQFSQHWRVGVREDAVWAGGVGAALAGSALDADGLVPRRTSVMIDYSTSEFGRFRLQYNYDNAQTNKGAGQEILFQYDVSLGAHGAHSY